MRYSRLIVMLAFVVLLGAACGDGGDGGGGDGGAGTATDTVTMVDNAFEPTDPAVSADSTLTLRNDGEAAHTFTLEDGSIDEQVEPGAEASVSISLEPGEYGFACSFHPEMSGTLTVQ
ncbi:MAG: cupredoxin domain-containing protein [Actinomycetota bacterium]